ncbi:MAG TPA: RecX family transcriptional regulator [Sphingomicrobium sp.]|nr:RecX family transcriptional regulator [Sphingomicrobium sp.]
MARLRSPRAPVPLDSGRLEELALRYVSRFATTRAKLIAYLARKLSERGWSGDCRPDPEGLAEKFSELGYVDDEAYALAKSRSLASRGYGKRRLEEKLRIAGVGDADSGLAREHAAAEAVEAAIRFAKRRRIGPFASGNADPKQREKAIAAMVRAGHSFELARVIADMPTGVEVDMNELCERFAK